VRCDGRRIAAVRDIMRRAADFLVTGDLTCMVTDGLRRILDF
jgi:hypothetical protein